MLRELRRLADLDLALDRTSIPLGSCTMKLNATTEMEPVTWPEFGAIHPFAPADQAEGYRAAHRPARAVAVRDHRLRRRVAPAQRRQPGRARRAPRHPGVAPGQRRRRSRRLPHPVVGPRHQRRVGGHGRACGSSWSPAPTPATSTSTTSAAKLDEHADRLAAIMVTYPSTHGVFEHDIVELCGAVHDAGGQVYVDGANLNALVGLAQPGKFGADVSHLNLHKTFCIPHGGGGPGRRSGGRAGAPGAVPAQPPARGRAGPGRPGVGPISAAPWGSAGILPIPWAYIRLMGPDGLTRATQVAILNANYVARRLRDHYPVLYTGEGDLVAHECILDLRPLTKATRHHRRRRRQAADRLRVPRPDDELPGRRHADGGAHRVRVPRRARPVLRGDDRHPGRGRRVPRGARSNAPHTAECLLVEDWEQPYSREQAAFPVRRAPHARSTGHRSAASTAATATATSSAPAPRSRRTSTI